MLRFEIRNPELPLTPNFSSIHPETRKQRRLVSFFAVATHQLTIIELNMTSSEKTGEANAADENTSFIFTVCVRSVPRYHFKLAYVVLQMAVKDFSKPTSENGEICRFNRSLLIESF